MFVQEKTNSVKRIRKNKNNLFLYTTTKEKPILRRKKLQNTSLQEKELAIILGGLLGDGSLKIDPNYKNARYSFRHSIKQESYFNFKVDCLKNLLGPKSIQLQEDRWSKNNFLHFSTRALRSLTIIHSVVSPKNKLEIKRKWLNHLTPLSLAIWWFDDGSIIGNGRKGSLSTHFTLKSQIVLIKYLKVVWDIEASYSPVKNYNKNKQEDKLIVEKENQYKGYRLYLNTSNLKKFLTIILPYVPSQDMLYKCILMYKESTLQERWISHTEELLPCTFKPLFRKYIEAKQKK